MQALQPHRSRYKLFPLGSFSKIERTTPAATTRCTHTTPSLLLLVLSFVFFEPVCACRCNRLADLCFAGITRVGCFRFPCHRLITEWYVVFVLLHLCECACACACLSFHFVNLPVLTRGLTVCFARCVAVPVRRCVARVHRTLVSHVPGTKRTADPLVPVRFVALFCSVLAV